MEIDFTLFDQTLEEAKSNALSKINKIEECFGYECVSLTIKPSIKNFYADIDDYSPAGIKRKLVSWDNKQIFIVLAHFDKKYGGDNE